MTGRACRACGQPIDDLHSSAKFCKAPACVTDRAKNRKRRERVGDVVSMVPKSEGRAGTVLGATLRRLDEAGVADTVDGATALALAARLDARQDTGSAMASLTRELRATMAAALKLAVVAADPIDQLRLQREKREQRAAGG